MTCRLSVDSDLDLCRFGALAFRFLWLLRSLLPSGVLSFDIALFDFLFLVLGVRELGVPEGEKPKIMSSWGPYTSTSGTAKNTGVTVGFK